MRTLERCFNECILTATYVKDLYRLFHIDNARRLLCYDTKCSWHSLYGLISPRRSIDPRKASEALMQ